MKKYSNKKCQLSERNGNYIRKGINAVNLSGLENNSLKIIELSELLLLLFELIYAISSEDQIDQFKRKSQEIEHTRIS